MQKALDFERNKFQVGKSDQFQVLQQEIVLANVQSNLNRLSSERLINRVSLHQALGGHFMNGVTP